MSEDRIQWGDAIDFDVLMHLLDAGSYDSVRLSYFIKSKSYIDVTMEFNFDYFPSLSFSITIRFSNSTTYYDVSEVFYLESKNRLGITQFRKGKEALTELDYETLCELYSAEILKMDRAIKKGVYND